jgi:hypothetical protein
VAQLKSYADSLSVVVQHQEKLDIQKLQVYYELEHVNWKRKLEDDKAEKEYELDHMKRKR